MALVRKGANYPYGTEGFSCSGVVVSSAEISIKATLNEVITDATGKPRAHIYGNPKATVAVSGFSTSISMPTIGSEVSAAGETATVISSRIVASNEDFQRVSVEAEAYPI